MSALQQMSDYLSTGADDALDYRDHVVTGIVSVRRFVDGRPEGQKIDDDDELEYFGQELIEVTAEVVLEALEREIFALGSARIIASEIGVYPSVIRRVRNRENSPSERLANRLGFTVRRDVLTRTKLRRMTYWMPVVECPDKPRAHARFSRDES